MGMFLFTGKKKIKNDCLNFVNFVFRRAYTSKQNCSKLERRKFSKNNFLRKNIKENKRISIKLVISLQVFLRDVYFFFLEMGIPFFTKSQSISLSPIFHFC